MKSKVDDLALKAFSVMTEDITNSLPIRLLTDKEKVTLGRRLIIAEAIRAGKTRVEINERISISPNTFTQIKRWIDSEQKTYTSAKTDENKNKENTPRRQNIKVLSYEDMKRRYPAHFLLFSIVEEIWKRK
jgi:uncharacterized protein YerC